MVLCADCSPALPDAPVHPDGEGDLSTAGKSFLFTYRTPADDDMCGTDAGLCAGRPSCDLQDKLLQWSHTFPAQAAVNPAAFISRVDKVSALCAMRWCPARHLLATAGDVNGLSTVPGDARRACC